MIREPSPFTWMRASAPHSASALRVNCTALASARFSRSRAMEAWITRQNTSPTEPMANTPTPRSARAGGRSCAPLPVPAPVVAHHEAADGREEHDALQHVHGAQVDADVAVEDVAELVRDHRLAAHRASSNSQRAAVSPPMAASPGDPTGGEGVDAFLALVRARTEFRHRHTGGNGHLLDDVSTRLAFIRRQPGSRFTGLAAEQRGHGSWPPAASS